ncbi:MAG: DUF6428 family protein [Planctomycetota bacterium]
MTIEQLLGVLQENPESGVEIHRDDQGPLPPHFHITEVGKVTRDFVDCGGTRRHSQVCLLQTWVADDVQHRLTASKLFGIVSMAETLEMDFSTAVEVECQGEHTIGTFQLVEARYDLSSRMVILRLQSKATACLAPELCCPTPSSPEVVSLSAIKP